MAGADTAVTVWLFARAGTDLDAVRRLVTSNGGTVRRSSRWLHAVSAHLPPAALRAALTAPALRHVQPVARFRRTEPAAPAALAAPAFAVIGPDSGYGPSAAALRPLRVFPLIERGFRGAGVRIALLDTGFETELPAFAGAAVAAQYDFVFNDSVVRNEPADVAAASRHGTAVWSLLAANVPDSLVGLAPDATYLLAKTEDIRSETPIEEDNFVAALEWADSLGTDIVSTSLGYRTFDGGGGYTFADLNGDVAVTTVAADMAAANGILVVAAVGNNGPASRSLTTPADGDSVLAVGAVDTLGSLAAFSGRGPTADGRVKPDLVAPGVRIWARDQTGFVRLDGTSLSTPLVAGVAALLREAHPTFGPVDLAAALRRTGTQAANPDTLRGWGVPDAFVAAVFPFGIQLAPPPQPLTAVSPQLRWRTDSVPAFAQPVAYRVRAGSDSTFAAARLDTVVSATTLTLPWVLRPGERLHLAVSATAADSARITTRTAAGLVGPAWVELATFNEAGGMTIRDLRPTFRWTAPTTAAFSGPFQFRIEVIRETDGTLELAADSLTALEWTPPRDLERNTPYLWRVTARLDGDSVTAASQGPFLVVDDSSPAVTTLFQNFPNPFPNAAIGRNATCIWFDLASEGIVRLDILDVRGLPLRQLLPGGSFGPFLRPGRYGRPSTLDAGQCDPELEWDGRAASGDPVPPGVYLARLITPDGTFVRRIVFLGLP